MDLSQIIGLEWDENSQKIHFKVLENGEDIYKARIITPEFIPTNSEHRYSLGNIFGSGTGRRNVWIITANLEHPRIFPNPTNLLVHTAYMNVKCSLVGRDPVGNSKSLGLFPLASWMMTYENEESTLDRIHRRIRSVNYMPCSLKRFNNVRFSLRTRSGEKIKMINTQKENTVLKLSFRRRKLLR